MIQVIAWLNLSTSIILKRFLPQKTKVLNIIHHKDAPKPIAADHKLIVKKSSKGGFR
jgi:hypothetical protein